MYHQSAFRTKYFVSEIKTFDKKGENLSKIFSF